MNPCEKAYPWAWRLVQASSSEDVSLMKIKGSEQREKLKEEIMSYIVTQSEGYISEEDQESAATNILEDFSKLSGYKFCVICGNTEGFPEVENQEPTAHTCCGCK